MFSYLHAYHAGNHADVLKHLILMDLVEAMQKKPAPVFMLDTHAGGGLYDLHDPMAQKLKEYEEGVGRFWEGDPEHPLLQHWLDFIGQFNPDLRLRYYPGSAALLAALMRPQDRLMVIDGHPQAVTALRSTLPQRRNISIKKMDGWQAMRAFLPPKEGRILVVIDPSYEQDADYQRVLEGVDYIRQKCRHAVIAIWYPLLTSYQIDSWVETLRVQSGLPSLLQIQLSVKDVPAGHGLYGSGLLIGNTPWRLDDQIQGWLPIVHAKLKQDAGACVRMDWLADDQGQPFGTTL